MSANRRRERAVQSELTPGEHLRAEIARLGLDQVAACKAISVSRQTVNNIINNRQSISRAMAGKLGRLTGRSSDYWLRTSFSSARYAEQLLKSATNVRSFGGGVLVNYQIAQAVKNNLININPFDEVNVQSTSVDLTLGDHLITNEGKKIDISDGQRFVLKSNCAVDVSTNEWIELPQDFVGRVGSITSLANLGLLTSVGFQVAPGFKGHLQFYVFNSGRKNIKLWKEMPIISIEIMRLSVTPSTNERALKQPRRGQRR